MTRRKRKKHWYRIYYSECMVCFRDMSVRERRYTRRPKSMKNRVSFEQEYCGCIR